MTVYLNEKRIMSFLRCFSCLVKQNDELVSKLDFSSNVLTDVSPNIWRHERTLEELHLSAARINSLPPELFYCQNLRILIANNNSLKTIPNAMASLRQLQILNLSRNLISNVPDNMRMCKNLTHLDLSFNNLKRLPDALSSLISLRELFLNETGLEFLPANFGRLINLRVLELRLNKLLTLPKSISRLTNLLRLDIGYNELTDMPEVIGELRQLRELWIDYNQIYEIPTSLCKLRDLVHFEAVGNNITSIAQDISYWKSIEVLSLCSNNLDLLPHNVGLLKSLVTLKCESNELKLLPESIYNLESVEELELSHNSLTYLPPTIGMLRKLRYLFLDCNDLLSLPEEICSCSELRILSISRNKIFELPKSIGQLAKLKVLNIVNNSISTIPVSILNLTNLTSLWISDNQSQPLVPLQYVESRTKFELTCFMLPQGSVSLNPQTHESSSLGISIRPETPRKVIQKTVSSSSKLFRRICFAENEVIISISSNLIFENLKSDKNPVNPAEVNKYERRLRSPTPYPKELLFLAKSIRTERNGNIDKNAESVQYSNNEEEQLDPKDTDNFFHMKKKVYSSRASPRYLTLNDDLTFNRIQNPQYQTSNWFETGINLIPINNSFQAPPYHTARELIRKSCEDLSNYKIRLKSARIDGIRVEAQNSGKELLTASHLDGDQTPVMGDDFLNIDEHCQHKHNSIDDKNLADRSLCSIKAKSDLHYVAKSIDVYNETNNIQIPKEISSRRSQWLFGVHKNPKVIQVILRWDKSAGFDIEELPLKEGVYVSFVDPKSNAARILCIGDKLLEIDSHDLTNANLMEAKAALMDSGTSMHIMLSRK
ncbi:protein lap1 isoform X2 [Ceratitis capitata]|nr:protein lap1 isoform X2 [Ceratitis capitata]